MLHSFLLYWHYSEYLQPTRQSEGGCTLLERWLHTASHCAFPVCLHTCGAAEMWFGVVLAIVVELVEPDVKSSTVAIFLFIINNVGGNMPLAVDGLSDVIGLSQPALSGTPGAAS